MAPEREYSIGRPGPWLDSTLHCMYINRKSHMGALAPRGGLSTPLPMRSHRAPRPDNGQADRVDPWRTIMDAKKENPLMGCRKFVGLISAPRRSAVCASAHSSAYPPRDQSSHGLHSRLLAKGHIYPPFGPAASAAEEHVNADEGK